jgi:hypothetical protein
VQNKCTICTAVPILVKHISHFLIVAGKASPFFKIILIFSLEDVQNLVDVGFAHLKIKFRRLDVERQQQLIDVTEKSSIIYSAVCYPQWS